MKPSEAIDILCAQSNREHDDTICRFEKANQTIFRLLGRVIHHFSKNNNLSEPELSYEKFFEILGAPLWRIRQLSELEKASKRIELIKLSRSDTPDIKSEKLKLESTIASIEKDYYYNTTPSFDRDRELHRILLECGFELCKTGALDRMEGLNKYNNAKADLVEAALDIANTIWLNDTDKALRIGDVASSVYIQLKEQGKGELLPEKTDTIKTWIKPIAPNYATRGGRPKKSRKK